MADPDRPHALETTYFWRYAIERKLYELFKCVINAVLTNPLHRLSLNGLLHDAVARIKRKVRPMPIAFHDSLGMGMRKRGKVTENVFLEFVDRLVLRSSAYRPLPVLPQNARPSPSKGVTQLFSLDEVKQLFSSREQLTALEPANSRSLGVPRQHSVTSIAALTPVFPHPGPAQTGPSDERPTPEVAAFTNKVVTTPVHHRVPF